ncbi:MAG: sugar transferase [Rhodobacteraceae bacterium]|nr:sugar transferase [Paracoccaceae bacterium]
MNVNSRDITADFAVIDSGSGLTIYNRLIKRGLDLLLVAIIGPLLLPVIALLWVLVRRDGGPGFYGHKRVGRDGNAFRCMKIRTMATNADELLKAHLEADPEARKEWDESHKLRNDPRITRVGRVLRKTSLDELPQLWNVLKGEMSFVGPRPIVRDELARYGANAWAYLQMRPGITGKWQVSGRNDVSYDQRVAFDVEYNREAGLLTDFGILVKTAKVVFLPTGY